MRSRCFAVFAGVLTALCALMPDLCAGNAKIGKHLDTDGLEYSVISAGSWRLASDKLDGMLDDMVWSNKLSAAGQRKVLRMITTFRLLRDLSGLEKAGGFGSSSSKLDNGYIHNRAFLALDPGAPGMINAFLGKSDISTRKFYRGLPAGTVFAISANISPEAVFKVLAQSGDFGETLLGYFPIAQSLPELFRQSSGEWQLILARSEEKLIWHLNVPDKENRWFAIAMMIGKKDRNFSADRVVMPFDLEKEFPVVVKKNGRISIFSSAAAEKYFTGAASLKFSKKIEETLFRRLPESGTMAMFANYAGDILGESEICGLKFSMASELPALGVLSRENDGWLYTENCDTTMFAGDALNVFLMYPRVKELMSMGLAGIDEEEKKDNDGDEAADEAEENKVCPCRDLLTVVGKLLKRKAVEPGFYTVSVTENNVKRLTACKKGSHKVVCFSRIDSSKPVPRAICATHDNNFCVLFSNDEIKCFQLEELGSYRRIIGYLQTQYMYDEKVFGKLMQEAAGFDSK